MDHALAQNWWLVVLRGALAILFGLAAFVWPSITFVVLVWMFGIYTLADGLVAIGTGLARTKDSRRWWAFFLEGMINIIAGVIALVRPDLAALVIVLLIASWAILTGILEIVAAIRLRNEINNEWFLALGGIVSIILGVILFLQPAAGGIALIWTVAAYAMIFGVLLIGLGFRLRNRNVPGDQQTLHST